MNPRRPWRVVKLGGSLLDWPELTLAWPAWYRRQAPCPTVVVVGGGELAEAIRRADARFGLNEVLAHQLCVEAMRTNARWVADRFSAVGLWAGNPPVPPCVAGEPVWLDPVVWLAEHEPKGAGARLPQGWHVTSDSIAARLAELLAAEELVLAKSRLPASRDPAGWESESLVDAYFSAAAAPLSAIRVVNLRDEAFAEVVWQRP